MSDVDNITRAFEQDDRESKVYSGSVVPPTYESISPEWLTEVLCCHTPGAKVVEHRLDERDDGSSNRRRIFMNYNDVGEAAELPKTVFCKMSEKLVNRVMLAATGAAEGEAIFYNKVAPLLDIEIPESIFARFDPDTFRSLIMMKDMAGRARFGHHTIEVTRQMAEGMVHTLAGLHGPMFEKPILDSLELRSWSTWWKYMLDATPDFDVACDRAFVESIELGLMSPALAARRDEIWPATMESARRHDDLPHTFTHNDVHFKNWYVINDGNRMGLSDWQIVCRGHWSRDLIYSLSTALTIENRRAWMEDLVNLYVELMTGYGVDMPEIEEVWLNLRQQLMTTLAFWTITLVPAPSMPDMQPRDITIEFLRRIYACMEDYNALDAF